MVEALELEYERSKMQMEAEKVRAQSDHFRKPKFAVFPR
jgi:hypothetical protein